jgi:hypothetical protein
MSADPCRSLPGGVEPGNRPTKTHPWLASWPTLSRMQVQQID